MSNEKVLVATYGSLRKGQHNHAINARAGGVSIGEGWTVNNCNLYQYCTAYFPSVSLVHNSNGKPVRVEVFETTQAGLEGPYDGLEGHRGNDNPYTFYKRTLIPVLLDSGETVEAWIYHIDEEQDVLVESGDWTAYLAGEKDDSN
ncbi:putative gamma-glutamyl cyclotransferase [Escherichia phage EK010]|uniref:Putative gamma-glutamyl cyclotransferase n=1 Tax=Escherichia phage EK010 TaxID=2742112 RepID=A0A6J4EGF9_9CAUD|nr:gamma-glutamyl cyclotransferase [Escherichia phage EK010]UYE89978.1 hypothetical protein [Escherichia phage E20-1]BCG44971.1 putative gamma-glutamyl cyclotransferase [Escherichia phage EK010]